VAFSSVAKKAAKGNKRQPIFHVRKLRIRNLAAEEEADGYSSAFTASPVAPASWSEFEDRVANEVTQRMRDPRRSPDSLRPSPVADGHLADSLEGWAANLFSLSMCFRRTGPE
jgi:hypothetical protein